MDAKRTELIVTGVTIDHKSGEPQVLLQDGATGKLFSLPVGPYEAGAILVELADEQPEEHFAHDLVVELFHTHGFMARHVELDLEPGCSSRLHYEARNGIRSIELRPSDALALSVRLGVPIYSIQDPVAAGSH